MLVPIIHHISSFDTKKVYHPTRDIPEARRNIYLSESVLDFLNTRVGTTRFGQNLETETLVDRLL
jgi:hypothetical protein